MTTKLKTTEIPNQAKHLFIQLYCEKKGGKNNENLHNAAQSWLSLSLTKKKHFFDTISTKTAVKKAQRIIKTEPYLRAKFNSNVKKRKCTKGKIQLNVDTDLEITNTENIDSSVCDDMECDNFGTSFPEEHTSETQPETCSLQTQNNTPQDIQESGLELRQSESSTAAVTLETESTLHNRIEECTLENTQSESSTAAVTLETESTLHNRIEECTLENTQSEPQITDAQKLRNTYLSVVDEDTDSSNEDNTKEKEIEKVPLTEPILPVAKTGKELYNLLTAKNGTTKPYKELTDAEKGYYAKAAKAIKKDYVTKYKEYLESLTSRQLFDYYMKIF